MDYVTGPPPTAPSNPRSLKPFRTLLGLAVTPQDSYIEMSGIESTADGGYAQLTNTNVRSFGWKGVTVTVKDRQSKQPKTILSDVNGIVKSGELLALMGPS